MAIKVTVELISAIDPKRSKVLGVALITNDGIRTTEDHGHGAYDVTLSKWAPKLNQVWKRAKVPEFDRVKRGPWDLLYLALRACVGDRNP